VRYGRVNLRSAAEALAAKMAVEGGASLAVNRLEALVGN